jgi:hypothetical protein
MQQSSQRAERSNALAIEAGHFVSAVNRAKAFFFAAAGLSFVISVLLFFTGQHERGIFVGIWVPSILSAGSLLLGKGTDR